VKDHWRDIRDVPAQARAEAALLGDPNLKHAVFADLEDGDKYSIAVAVRDPATGEMASALLKHVAILPSALLSMVDAFTTKGD
jgi:hypothetical protein